MIPGSMTLVQSIKAVLVIYNITPIARIMYRLVSPKRDTGATKMLKKVAGTLIILPVNSKALGFSPIKQREDLPHILILLSPLNFLMGSCISLCNLSSRSVRECSLMSALVSLMCLYLSSSSLRSLAPVFWRPDSLLLL